MSFVRSNVPANINCYLVELATLFSSKHDRAFYLNPTNLLIRFRRIFTLNSDLHYLSRDVACPTVWVGLQNVLLTPCSMGVAIYTDRFDSRLFYPINLPGYLPGAAFRCIWT